MPKQRHGCSFTQRWTKVVCILASCQCDYRIVQSVYNGLAMATCEIFATSNHIPLCRKTFGPRKVQNYNRNFFMWKNGIVVDVRIKNQQCRFIVCIDLDFKKVKKRTFYSLTWDDTWRYNVGKLNIKKSIRLLNGLALLSKCDFTFWRDIYIKYAIEMDNYRFVPDAFEIESNFYSKLHLYWGFIRIEFYPSNKNYFNFHYYYHPLRPNVATLMDYLAYATAPETWEGGVHDAYIKRICKESKTTEIRDFLDANRF